MNPLQTLPAPAGRPEHRLHPLHGRLLRADLRAPEPELRDRHPGRPGDHPGLHRLRQPAAQRGRAAAHRRWPVVLFILELTVTSHGLLTIGGLVCLRARGGGAVHRAGQPDGAAGSRSRCRDHRDDGRARPRSSWASSSSSPSARGGCEAARHWSASLSRSGTVGEVRTPLAPVGHASTLGARSGRARTADERSLQRGTSRAHRPPGRPDAHRRASPTAPAGA